MAEGDNGVYHRTRCACFRKTQKDFGGLSNMAGGFPLRVNGVLIRSSEAIYQACRFPERPDIQRRIIEQTSPWIAKMQAKPYREQSRKDWEQVKLRIMRWCLRLKLAHNWPAFHQLLLFTGDRMIVEDSSKDRFWGAVPEDEEILVGDNHLGRLLVELRDDLRRPDVDALRNVEPVAIPDFCLYGEPITAVRARPSPDEPSLAASGSRLHLP